MSARPTGANESGLWPTPGAAKANNDISLTCSGDGRQKPNKLGWAVANSMMWPTPKANDAEKRGNFDVTNPRNGLPAAAKAWPTLTASLGTKGGRVTPRKSREGGTLIEAMSARQNWPTPVATMSKGSSPNALTRKDGQDCTNDRLDHAVMASDGGQLNPTWVEWLMGWPLGWTDLRPLATDRCRNAPPQPGVSSVPRTETADV